MNWSWSRRRPGKGEQEKRKQQDFFERQKFLSTVKRVRTWSPGSSRRKGISQDLLSLHLVNKAHAPQAQTGSSNENSKSVNAVNVKARNPIVKVDLDQPTPYHKPLATHVDLGPPSPGKPYIPSNLEFMEASESAVNPEYHRPLPAQSVNRNSYSERSANIHSQKLPSEQSENIFAEKTPHYTNPNVPKVTGRNSMLTPANTYNPFTKPQSRVSFSTQLRYNDSFEGEQKCLSSDEIWKPSRPVKHFWEQETPVLIGKKTERAQPKNSSISAFPGKPVKVVPEKKSTNSPCLDYGDFWKKQPSRNDSFKFPLSASNGNFPLSNSSDDKDVGKGNLFKRHMAHIPEDFQMTPLKKYAKESHRQGNSNPNEKCDRKEEKSRQDKNHHKSGSSKKDKSEPKHHDQKEVENGSRKSSVLDILDDSKYIKDNLMTNEYFDIDFDELNPKKVPEKTILKNNKEERNQELADECPIENEKETNIGRRDIISLGAMLETPTPYEGEAPCMAETPLCMGAGRASLLGACRESPLVAEKAVAVISGGLDRDSQSQSQKSDRSELSQMLSTEKQNDACSNNKMKNEKSTGQNSLYKNSLYDMMMVTPGPVGTVVMDVDQVQDHVPNGHVPNGHVPNGHVPNGHVPNGHVPSGHIAVPHVHNDHVHNGHVPSGHIAISMRTLGSKVKQVNEPQGDLTTEGHTGYNVNLNNSWMEFVSGANMVRIPPCQDGEKVKEKESDGTKTEPVETGSNTQEERDHVEREQTIEELLKLEAEDDIHLQRDLEMEEEMEQELALAACDELHSYEMELGGMSGLLQCGALDNRSTIPTSNLDEIGASSTQNPVNNGTSSIQNPVRHVTSSVQNPVNNGTSYIQNPVNNVPSSNQPSTPGTSIVADIIDAIIEDVTQCTVEQLPSVMVHHESNNDRAIKYSEILPCHSEPLSPEKHKVNVDDNLFPKEDNMALFNPNTVEVDQESIVNGSLIPDENNLINSCPLAISLDGAINQEPSFDPIFENIVSQSQGTDSYSKRSFCIPYKTGLSNAIPKQKVQSKSYVEVRKSSCKGKAIGNKVVSPSSTSTCGGSTSTQTTETLSNNVNGIRASSSNKTFCQDRAISCQLLQAPDHGKSMTHSATQTSPVVSTEPQPRFIIFRHESTQTVDTLDDPANQIAVHPGRDVDSPLQKDCTLNDRPNQISVHLDMVDDVSTSDNLDTMSNIDHSLPLHRDHVTTNVSTGSGIKQESSDVDCMSTDDHTINDGSIIEPDAPNTDTVNEGQTKVKHQTHSLDSGRNKNEPNDASVANPELSALTEKSTARYCLRSRH